MEPSQSYAHHATSFSEEASAAAIEAASAIWYDENAIDTWRHARAYEIADVLKDESGSWLTVGDGRFGLDAQRLAMRGIPDVLPTDICPGLLEAAKQRGHIAEYRVENAESLSFASGSFDYVFMKEAYHHFPRPPIAFYEMLRVARRAVFLVEPFDRARSPLRSLLTFCRSIIARRRIHADAMMFEEKDRNYVFTLSVREVEKMAIALGLPMIAYKTYTDIYDTRLNDGSVGSGRFHMLRARIMFREFLARIRLDGNTMIRMAVFKQPPSDATRSAMEAAGWTLLDLPRNPYLR